MKRILPDCVSEAYVVVNGRDGTWHVVNRSGASRLVATQGEPRYPDAPFAALERDARERQRYSPGRVFVAVLHSEMPRYGFEAR